MRNIYISGTKTENYWWSKINIIIYNNRISKIINLLDDTTNQPSKFRTRNWVEINDESRRTYNVNSDIRFKTLTIRSNLCDNSDAYIHVKATIDVRSTTATGAPANSANIYSKKSGSLWQYYRDEPVLDHFLIVFLIANNRAKRKRWY